MSLPDLHRHLGKTEVTIFRIHTASSVTLIHLETGIWLVYRLLMAYVRDTYQLLYLGRLRRQMYECVFPRLINSDMKSCSCWPRPRELTGHIHSQTDATQP